MSEMQEPTISALSEKVECLECEINTLREIVYNLLEKVETMPTTAKNTKCGIRNFRDHVWSLGCAANVVDLANELGISTHSVMKYVYTLGWRVLLGKVYPEDESNTNAIRED